MKKSKYHGCILGKAVGDALGFPVEGEGPKECKMYVNNLDPSKPIPPRGSIKAGQITDDTQLALELMQSLIEYPKFDAQDYAKRIGEIFDQNLVIGEGIATRQAADRIIEGVDISDTGTPAPSAGNGTAMRAAPIGLIFFDDMEKLISVSKAQTVLTHKDTRCIAGSLVMSGAVAYLLKLDAELNVADFIKYLSNLVIDISPLFAKTLLQLLEVLETESLGAVRLISGWGEPDFIDGWKFISPYVIPSVCWSLYAFIKHPNSFEDAIFTSIEVGGDVDTTAAMTGALSGTYLGLESIPQVWREMVHDRDRWDYHTIIETTDQLFEISQ